MYIKIKSIHFSDVVVLSISVEDGVVFAVVVVSLASGSGLVFRFLKHSSRSVLQKFKFDNKPFMFEFK